MSDGTRQDGERDFVLGIDFGGTKVAVAAADRTGRVLRSLRLDTRAADGAAQAVERALRAAREMREALETEGGRCVAAGAVSPGVVHEDRIPFAPNVPGWEDLRLRHLTSEALELEVVACANDVKAGGLAEARWGALRDADPGIFLSLGTGIGAAVVVGGRVLGGAHGAAGEIGYLLRDASDTAGVASGRAPLEEYASGIGLARRGSSTLGEPATAAGLFASADARARALVADALDQLAVHVANLAITVDPARIAVGGGMMASAERVLPALERRLKEFVPFPPDLVPARYVQDSALRGALALALDATGGSRTPSTGAEPPA
ncbi:ROK family protein [Streptomyces sp. PTM05]|uniref:ROK family protein n=1 Tax=Streptantibioticus parmotrematis TaxID=2873249 RepID=A0ABS7QRQ5_9ACTN|nr:ROK family protein [Streptantibioticus parmotrematis]MBY8884489.1 ROK family protein [Streptantibioticus parmotrematis]